VAGESPHRYICFCGATVIGVTVCEECAAAMVRALLNALPATAAVLEKEPDAEFAESVAAGS
jgi:hypothetical protein